MDVKNIILNDFGDDGLEIDISTRSYTKSILIDRDTYYAIQRIGRITALGSKHVVVQLPKQQYVYLGRYILGLTSSDKKFVVQTKDGLYVDYRKKNLEVVPYTAIDRWTNRRKN
jgi:hypothetical protein